MCVCVCVCVYKILTQGHAYWFYRVGKRGRETSMWDSSTNRLPLKGSLTGDWTCKLGLYTDWELNLWPFGLQESAPINWAIWVRAFCHILIVYTDQLWFRVGEDYTMAGIPGKKYDWGPFWRLSVTFIFTFPPGEIVPIGGFSNCRHWDACWLENSKEKGGNKPKEIILQPHLFPLLSLHSQLKSDEISYSSSELTWFFFLILSPVYLWLLLFCCCCLKAPPLHFTWLPSSHNSGPSLNTTTSGKLSLIPLGYHCCVYFVPCQGSYPVFGNPGIHKWGSQLIKMDEVRLPVKMAM